MSVLDRRPEPCAIVDAPKRRHYSYVLDKRDDGPGRQGKSLCGRICGDQVALLAAGHLTALTDLERCGGCLRALGIPTPRKRRNYADPNHR